METGKLGAREECFLLNGIFGIQYESAVARAMMCRFLMYIAIRKICFIEIHDM